MDETILYELQVIKCTCLLTYLAHTLHQVHDVLLIFSTNC